MIDLLTEDLIPLAHARQHRLLKTSRGTAPSFQTINRWANLGVRGIKLETVMKPSGLFTTEAAMVRFIERLSMPNPEPKAETPSQRRKAIARAKAILANV